MKNNKLALSTRRGSVLAYSLIIISMMLAIAASLSISSVVGKKAASSTEFSIQALQTADSGVQLALVRLNECVGNGNIVSAIAANGSVGNCSNAVLTSADNIAGPDGSKFELTFYKQDGTTKLECNDKAEDIRFIKSIGTYKNTVRAVNVAVGINGNDANVKLLLHADGPDNSTNFIDSEKTSPKTVNIGGGAPRIKTAFKKFGNASLYLDGASYLSVPNSSDFDFESGDFTMDWWEYPTAPTHLALAREPIKGYQAFAIITFNNLLYMSSSGTSWDVADEKYLGDPVLNAWTHYAIVRSGNTFYTFQNGVQKNTWTSSASLMSGNGNLQIGLYENDIPNKYYSTGYFDELRISKGSARWTSNFTPPTSSY